MTQFKDIIEKNGIVVGNISEAEIIEAVKQITLYGWAKGKGFDKVKLVTPLQEIRNYNNIRDLQNLVVLYHK